ATFNKLATRLNTGVYWAIDADKDGIVDPDEVASLLFFPDSESAPAAGRTKWVDGAAFTPAFAAQYEKLVSAASEPAPTGPDAARRMAVRAELDEAASVLVKANLKGASPEDARFVRHMQEVARLIDELYEVQTGIAKVAPSVANDAESKSLFRRNRGPACKTPRFEKDAACSAIPGAKEPPVDVYPDAMQKDGFCKTIEGHKDAKKLTTPFTVVREKNGKLEAVPYTVAYATQMKKVAEELRKTAADVQDPKEKALVTYLNAAAKSFETNDWKPADEAWSKMNSRNSRWYVRVGPDETYWEPGSLKAGFHLSFAKINTDSLALMDKLAPVQQKMEDELAKLIGAPYTARKVSFHLPDFIDIVLNAGDDRDGLGGTIGQSLPNWGPVANEGRGRTVVMANLYGDPDSLAVRRKKAESFISSETAKSFTDEGGAGLMGTVLHEATHNLGPAHEYKYQNKKDDEAFGGELSSMLEELKAQSGAYYYLYLLLDEKVISQTAVEQTIVDNIVWSMNHISKGMYSNGKRRPYSQLAAIHIGFFMDRGALVWQPKAKAANGTDVGAFSVDFTKMRAASVDLMKLVATIKAKNDKDGALALANKYVEKGTIVPMDLITERALRFPQSSFVYALDL
ncbi:MAG: hypothetical protein JNK04_05905, partial [Myxococcales bacterium]|nr:hypothetical protein [Myxococcales bacterium]